MPPNQTIWCFKPVAFRHRIKTDLLNSDNLFNINYINMRVRLRSITGHWPPAWCFIAPFYLAQAIHIYVDPARV